MRAHRTFDRRMAAIAASVLALAGVDGFGPHPVPSLTAAEPQSKASKPAALKPQAAGTTAPPFPERFEWQRRAPSEVGMNQALLDEAVQFAIANENPATKDLA
ncbi:MAG: hypothetical protein EHM13_00205, partial [Acidobacteria bacterium]